VAKPSSQPHPDSASSQRSSRALNACASSSTPRRPEFVSPTSHRRAQTPARGAEKRRFPEGYFRPPTRFGTRMAPSVKGAGACMRASGQRAAPSKAFVPGRRRSAALSW
jgi:hypothetical protein